MRVRPNAVIRFWLLNIVVAPIVLDFHEFDPGSLIYMQFSVSFLILLSFHRKKFLVASFYFVLASIDVCAIVFERNVSTIFW